MERIAIIGVGSVEYGDHRTVPCRTLGAQAVIRALEDAKISWDRIDCAYVGYGITGLLDGQEGMIGQLALREVGITGIPITRVENACSSSSCAVRESAIAIRAGESEIALAFGVEKMLGYSTEDAMRALAGDGDVPLESNIGLTFPGVFAIAAQTHMREFGTPREALAAVAEKAHANASLNPHAHLRNPITRDEALNGRIVADPLTIYDCCPISDGASAVVLASERIAKSHPGPVVWLDACVLATGTYDSISMTSFEATRRASQQAYECAGIGPNDIDIAEVHDCFTIAEIMHTEDLGFFEKGDGGFATLRGDTQINGKKPINASGGLKAKGHPVGATGAGQLVEVTKQLRREAGERQVEGAKTALTHCMGGFFAQDCGSIVINVVSR
ncbi:MAG: beta-ketoacyl synthase N-terminal-like domain-containing protein [Gammaproteobacteria bacterium]|nr:beta-ketoacyl synthase N-terminal-like domain-containing protein [Gammaproteobacteria bacterium]